MPSKSPARSKPVTPAGFRHIAAGGAFLKRTAGGTVRERRGSLKRWALRALVAVVVLVVLWELFVVLVNLLTNNMWFDSVNAAPVYHTMLGAQILLFVVFAVVAGLVGGATTIALQRIRPPLYLSADNDTFRWTFRKYEPRLRKLIVLLGIVIPAILVGKRAVNGWQTYLLWDHAQSFGVTDPLFHKDASFYVEVYPFHQLIVTLLMQAVVYGLWIAILGGYWYGLWRLRRGSKKITKGFTQLLSALLIGYLVLRAANYWLSRYALTTSSRGPVTGPSYTDTTAALPGKYVLVGIMLVGAAVLLANVLLGSRVRLLAVSLVTLLVLTEIVGSAWPGLLFHFREAPSAVKLDLGEISQNQKATLAAFGLDGDVSTQSSNPSTTLSTDQLVALADKTAQIPVVDPNKLSPTFTVQQQLQSYYGFKGTLDTSHYEIAGASQDVVLAVRELQLGGIPSPSWVNQHLVYTHGYGVVAAPTTRVDPKTESPAYLKTGSGSDQQIPVTRPQVYFGQAFSSSSYAIVGQPAGSKRNIEFDHPGGADTTYDAHGGIPVGSLWRRLLFAVNLGSPNIFFSSELNSASQLLTVRNPRTRVAKVAPWLTLDGDVYPAVVHGQLDWIVDGYTTSSNYPNSQLVNLHSATSTSLTTNGATVQQPNRQVNYMKNSVKAVVNAYTGQVSLYEWNQAQDPDPLLKAWESVYPGLVKPQSDIPTALTPQLRYPTDLFNVQRSLVAKYRVKKPVDFYSGNDFWTVPANTTGAGGTGSSIPSQYMSNSADGYGTQSYSLSSPMVTLSGQQLAGYVYVNAEPGHGYGKFTIVNYTSPSSGESPAQVANDIESDTKITKALTLQRGGNSRVVLGDLEAIPVAGKMLYVEPVYTQSNGGTSFPILRHVIALYGDGQPSFESKLDSAVRVAIASANEHGSQGG